MKNFYCFLVLALLLAANSVFAQPSCANLVKNFGKEENKYYISNITKLNDKIALFFGTDEFYGTELWRTDGTPQGTTLVKDIFPGLRSSVGKYVSEEETFVYAGIMYFYADTPGDNTTAAFLWRSDGTATGTYQLTASTDRNKALLAEYTTFTIYKNAVYFWSSRTLYKTQGTIESTFPVIGSDSNPAFDNQNFIEYKGELWFVADRYFWHTDGTKTGTIRIDYKLNRTPDALQIVGDKLYFALQSDLWQTDGTPTGMKLVREGVYGFSGMYTMNNLLYFGPFLKKGLWRSDGTLFGTYQLIDAQLGQIFSYKNELYFVVYEPISNQYTYNIQIWKTNGTRESTVKIVDLDKTSIGTNVNSISSFFEKDGKLYFSLGDYNFTGKAAFDEIWQTDATQVGTRFICSLRKDEINQTFLGNNSGEFNSPNIHLTIMDNYLLYIGTEGLSNNYSNNIYLTNLTNCPSITPTITGTATFCPNGSTTLTATAVGGAAPYTYRWQQGTTAVGANTSSLPVNTAGAYTVTATDANGCSGTAQLAVTQTANLPVSITGNNAFCAGASTTLSASVSGGTMPFSFQWKQGTANVGSNANTYVVMSAGSYAVEVSDGKGCKGTSAGLVVSQRPAPATPSITASVPSIVTGQTATLQATVATGLTLQWLLNGTPLTGASQASYAATQGGSYTLRVTTAEGCSATSTPVSIALITALEPQPGAALSLRVAPNPSAGGVEVHLQTEAGRTESVTLSLTDLLGRRLFGKQIRVEGQHVERLDLSGVTSGVYLLNANTATGQATLRILRQ